MGDSTEIKFAVRGMTCSHCVSSVQKALESVSGAEEVSVTLDPPQAVVRGKDLSAGDLLRVVAEAGFTAIRS